MDFAARRLRSPASPVDTTRADRGDSWRPNLAFEVEERIDRGDSEPAFIVDVDGFEGPLDLLLELARRQKVDLARISVLALAEQYLAFIEAGAARPARTRRRLSGDGRVARLSQIPPAAAGAAEGGGAATRRNSPKRWRGACAGWRQIRLAGAEADQPADGSGATFSRAASRRRSGSPAATAI